MESVVVSQRGDETRSRGRVGGCFLRDGRMIRGQGGNKKKKKRLWMNESLRGEKQRRVGKVCVCEQSRYTHTHTHVRTGCACSHHFCFPHTRLNCLLPFSLHCRHLQVLCLYPSLETSSSSCIVVHRHCCTGDMWLHYQVHSDSGPHTTSPAHQRKQTIFQNKQFPLSINLYSIINV